MDTTDTHLDYEKHKLVSRIANLEKELRRCQQMYYGLDSDKSLNTSPVSHTLDTIVNSLRSVWLKTQVGVALLDLNLRYKWNNIHWCIHHELTDNLTGHTHYEMSPSADSRWERRCQQCLNGKEVRINIEKRTYTDGSVRWLSWEMLPVMENEQVLGILITTNDCSHQQQQQAGLEQQLDTLSHQFHKALHIADFGYAVYSTATQTFKVNPRAAHMFEMPSQPSAGAWQKHLQTLGNLFPLQRAAQDTARHRQEQTLKVPMRAGGTRHIFAYTEQIQDMNHKAHTVFAFYQDKTGLQEMEAVLQISKRNFHEIFDHAFQCMALLSPTGMLLEANHALMDKMGHPPIEEVTGVSLWQLPIWPTSARHSIKRALIDARQGERSRHETIITQPSGEHLVLDISIQPVRTPKGTVHTLVFEAHDLTETYHMQQALADNQRLFTAFMSRAPLLAWIKRSDDFTYHFINPPYAQVLGKSVEDAMGKTDFELLPEHTAQQIRANDESIKRKQKPLQTIENIALPHRPYAYSMVYKFPLLIDKHTPGIAGIAIDITEQVKAKAHVEALNYELENLLADRTEEAQSAKGELTRLAYSIAHDLRAPLRHIVAYSDMLNESIANTLPDTERTYLERVLSSAERMGTLIDELLKYARSDKVELTFNPVDLNQVVQQLKQQLIPKDRNIEWYIAPLPTVVVDLQMISQVFQNLMDNAIKFTGTRPIARIQIHYASRNDFHEITISDNGVGFNPAFKHRLFRLFHRLHHNRDFNGTGIGLANVARILERHGGNIEAKGEIDQGASFTLRLPIHLSNHGI